MLTADKLEDLELLVPNLWLLDAGEHVDIAAPTLDDIGGERRPGRLHRADDEHGHRTGYAEVGLAPTLHNHLRPEVPVAGAWVGLNLGASSYRLRAS